MKLNVARILSSSGEEKRGVVSLDLQLKVYIRMITPIGSRGEDKRFVDNQATGKTAQIDAIIKS